MNNQIALVQENANQWVAEQLRPALRMAAEHEVQRRSALNVHLVRGLKLSVRQEAVERDIMRNWLDAAVQAGNA